ncbi:Na-translocating system protein MpsC family protein [Paenibacillus glycanilyticus]|uniref:Na-translocating system protein MpsC family protein n=1 Tax=Paenibacillus glycanilyticus TaxID=126569 RepID=UPI00190FFF46|nr:Na-translocating system protein MpsC family protein [Paenibacillus glycanilyticus]
MILEKEAQAEIASYVGRLLREAFGRGPQSIFVSINRPFVVLYLRNFLSPTEKILLEQDQIHSIQSTRDLLMKSLIPEIKAYLLLLAGMDIQEFYYDWGLHNHSGVMVGVEGRDAQGQPLLGCEYTGKDELQHEISLISQQVQKRPDELYSCLINDRTLLVIRVGILISIEKELIRIGHEESLRLAKRNLEKGHLHNNGHFQEFLNAKVIDLFVDWDFHLDKSVMVFILNPNQ